VWQKKWARLKHILLCLSNIMYYVPLSCGHEKININIETAGPELGLSQIPEK
jgi:hypothetical protein